MENFQRKIMQMVESGAIPKSEFANLNIQHDDWCDRLNGVGPCNCDPEVVVYPASDMTDWVTTFLALRSHWKQ
jgi:hypothetical protein